MSKYLRTKDNLYEVESSFVDYKGKTIYQSVKNVLIEETDVIKKADTIEELCDEFVVIKGDCKCLYKQSDIFDCQDKNAVNDLIKNNEIYGAIFTDKGLIYKAKLNKESGVLELL